MKLENIKHSIFKNEIGKYIPLTSTMTCNYIKIRIPNKRVIQLFWFTIIYGKRHFPGQNFSPFLLQS